MALAFWGDSMTNQMLLDTPTALAVFTGSGQVVFNGGFGGQNTAYVLGQFEARPWRRNWVNLFWGGQNLNGTAAAEAASIHAMIDELGHDDFLVISGVNDGHSAEWQGPSGERYLKLMAYNAELAAAYPDNFLDLHGILVADGIANEDENSVLYDAPPTYYAPTDIHFDTDGYVRAATEILAKVEAMGLTTQGALNRQIARSGGR
jgi:hypothetical protein